VLQAVTVVSLRANGLCRAFTKQLRFEIKNKGTSALHSPVVNWWLIQHKIISILIQVEINLRKTEEVYYFFAEILSM